MREKKVSLKAPTATLPACQVPTYLPEPDGARCRWCGVDAAAMIAARGLSLSFDVSRDAMW
jgi:hypothetical protein